MASKEKTKFKKWHFLVAITSLICLLVYLGIYKHLHKNYQILYSSKNSFGEIWVYNEGDKRCLTFEKPNIKTPEQSCVYIDDVQVPVFKYHQMILGALYINPQPKKILMLGLGGGSLVKYFQKMIPDYAKFDIVDINPELKKISKEFFFLEENKKTKIFIEDAYQYVARAFNTKNYYDLVIIDLFLEEYIPNQFLSPNFIKILKGILAPNGVAAINTFTHAKTHNKESELIAKEFGNFYNLVEQNRVILAYNGAFPPLKLIEYNAEKLHDRFHELRIEQKWLLSKFIPYKEAE